MVTGFLRLVSLFWEFGVELIDLRANTAHSNRVSRIYSAAAAAKLLHQPLVSHILSKYLGEESTCLTSLPAVASGSAWPLDYVFLSRTCLVPVRSFKVHPHRGS
jgi:hypothetical protein